MKQKFLLVSLLLLVGNVTFLFAFNPSDLERIEFSNDTGFELYYLFFSPSDSEYWGPDILGSTTTLADGDSQGFYVSHPSKCNDFDILAIDADGDSYTVYGYRICSGDDVFLNISMEDYEAGSPDFDFVSVLFTNTTDYRMDFLFFSPADSEMWGAEILNDSTYLYPGDTVSITIPSGGKNTPYDMLAVDEDGDTYYRQVRISNRQDEYMLEIDYDDFTNDY